MSNIEIVESLRSLYPLQGFEEEAITEVVKEFRELKEKKHDCDIKHLFGECSYAETGCSDCIGKLKIKDALEKATAKKPIYSDFDENEEEEIIPYKAVCPVCGYEFEFGTWNDEQNHHCECGQRMLWD